MQQKIKEFCSEVYDRVYTQTRKRLETSAVSNSRKKTISAHKEREIENYAQKEAIKSATVEGMRCFSTIDAEEIWKVVYQIHVHRKSGVNDLEIIKKVVSADQSWKVSSGHAFEEIIQLLSKDALLNTNLNVLLPGELLQLIDSEKLFNEPRDISWLKDQLRGKVFDLYITVTRNDGHTFCFGCIQCKTSIRDRVTRDREPSVKAMASYFWSIAFALDGEFLRYPEFKAMVNGNSEKHTENGWHGMYVFSDKYSDDRIYKTDPELINFKEHALIASKYWLTQRQWFNSEWRAVK
jgi:hypothetical protein